MKRNSRRFSRRRFLTVGSVTLGGIWSGCSNQVSARTLRNIVADATRTVHKPGFTPEPLEWDANGITAAWLGHSTVLLNFLGFTVLTDPVLLRRIGADTALGTIGPKRLVAPALRPEQLPPIDLVLLSHAHMDHLDPSTLRDLPGRPKAVTAHATRDLLYHTKLTDPVSLRWGERTIVRTGNGDLEVEAFEVKHWGARWRVDNYRGYNGYILSREGKKIIFGGDTAYISTFKDLKSKGPFEMAIMPIGAYDPWIHFHCNPEQAIQMTNEAGARMLLPIHFKTFPLGREGTIEPMRRLEASIENSRIGWREVGQTYFSA